MKNIGIDEMYQSVGCKGIKKNDPRTRGLKKRGRGTYQKDKPPILTIVERKTGLTIFSVEKIYHIRLIQNKLEKHCIKPVRVFTDDYIIYSNLKKP